MKTLINEDNIKNDIKEGQDNIKDDIKEEKKDVKDDVKEEGYVKDDINVKEEEEHDASN